MPILGRSESAHDVNIDAELGPAAATTAAASQQMDDIDLSYSNAMTTKQEQRNSIQESGSSGGGSAPSAHRPALSLSVPAAGTASLHSPRTSSYGVGSSNSANAQSAVMSDPDEDSFFDDDVTAEGAEDGDLEASLRSPTLHVSRASPQAIKQWFASKFSKQHFREMGNNFVTLFSQARRRNLLFLYCSHLLSSWGDRLWKFGVPFALAERYPDSMTPVAVFGAFPLIVSFFFGGAIGHIVDHFPRLAVLTTSLVLQNLSVAIAAALVSLVLLFENEPKNDIIPFSSPTTLLLFLGACLFAAFSSLASTASSVSVVKDWAIVISQYHRQKLQDMNATLRRIDLLCDVLTPVAFSVLLDTTTGLIAVITVSSWNIVSFFPELLLLLAIYRNTPTLAVPRENQHIEHSTVPTKKKKKKKSKAATDATQASASDQKAASSDGAAKEQQSTQEEEQDAASAAQQKFDSNPSFFTVLFKGWRIYLQQSVLLPSLAYVLLYISVLHHGSVMVQFLTSRRLHKWSIGIFRSASAFYGLIATIISPIVISKFGVRKGGLVGIYSQFFCLLLAIVLLLVVVFLGLPDWVLYFFLGFIIISRTGLWSFDLAETQLMQLSVPEGQRGIINATESSLTKLAEFFILMLTFGLHKPELFWILALVSFASVLLALILYTIWIVKYRNKDIGVPASLEGGAGTEHALSTVHAAFMHAAGEDENDAGELVFSSMLDHLDETAVAKSQNAELERQQVLKDVDRAVATVEVIDDDYFNEKN